jgi:RHS repeat-associated protein
VIKLSATRNAYDANGNTLIKTDSTGITTYNWDYENRLTSVVLPGSGGTVTFKYDPFGRRIYKSSSSGTSIFAYDGYNLAETVNVSGGVVARYAQDLNIDAPLAMLRGSTTDYYEADGLNSITSLTDSTGALAQTYTYDSFGNTVATTGALRNYFQYTGREFDTETTLYYYRARYYDPQSGRFNAEDPSTFDGGINFYSYVGNDPTSTVDPFGLKVLNPNNYPVSAPVMAALEKFNQAIGCDKDVVISGGNRLPSSKLGAGSNSQHVLGTAADVVVPGQSNLETANQAEQSGLFGGIGWYQEGFRGPNGEGPHVHVDLRKGTARWGFPANGNPTHGYIPTYPTHLNPSKSSCGCN